jgi:hypothetical protein
MQDMWPGRLPYNIGEEGEAAVQLQPPLVEVAAAPNVDVVLEGGEMLVGSSVAPTWKIQRRTGFH